MRKNIYTFPLFISYLLPLLAISLAATSCSAKEMGTDPELVSSKSYKVEKVYEGKGVVWGFDFIDESRALISHKGGELYLYNTSAGKKTKLSSPEVYSKGQGGLLDVVYKKLNNKEYVYMTFSDPVKDDKVVTSLARGVLNGDKLEELETIFRSNAQGDSSKHYGSRLVFHDDSIFMTIGDRGERDLAQNLSKHNGSVLRLTLDGKPHPENPFIGKDGLDEIYSYGHRNSQGIDVDPVSKEVYLVEMGPRGGDELNLVQKGKNYGWPEVTYGTEYYGPKIGTTEKEGMEGPVTYWVPSISPSGMAFYTGDKIKEWKNHIFLACLSGAHLRKVVLKDGKVVEQTALFQDIDERFRHVRNAPDGYLYFSTDSGKIFRVSSKK